MRVLAPWHPLILATVSLALFGAERLPESARSLGEAMNILKRSAREGRDPITSTLALFAAPGPPDPARTDQWTITGSRAEEGV
jgi:sec-independent protein translocase protein TatA